MISNFDIDEKKAVFYNGMQISAYKYDVILEESNHIIAYNDDMFSIYDENGKQILSERLRFRKIYNHELILVSNSENKYGLYSINGDLVLPVQHYIISVSHNKKIIAI